MLISVIIPMYNEEEVILKTHERLTQVMGQMGLPYELLYVNDGSRDKTLPMMKDVAEEDSHVRLLSFARNRGHQIAVTAGLDNCVGDAAVIIDADLQDPPEIIPDMVELWQQGYDVVYGKRTFRKGESFLKKLTASMYYKFVSSLSGFAIPRDSGDFRLISRRMVDAMKQMPEHSRYLRGMYAWVGFRQTPIEFVREERFAGETKYTLRKMLKLAADGIFSFSSRPLGIVGGAGAGLIGAGLLYLVVLLVLSLCGVSGLGWQVVVATILAVGGFILCGMGILGAYIARIFEDVQGRPLYFLAEKIGFEEKGEEQ